MPFIPNPVSVDHDDENSIKGRPRMRVLKGREAVRFAFVYTRQARVVRAAGRRNALPENVGLKGHVDVHVPVVGSDEARAVAVLAPMRACDRPVPLVLRALDGVLMRPVLAPGTARPCTWDEFVAAAGDGGSMWRDNAFRFPEDQCVNVSGDAPEWPAPGYVGWLDSDEAEVVRQGMAQASRLVLVDNVPYRPCAPPWIVVRSDRAASVVGSSWCLEHFDRDSPHEWNAQRGRVGYRVDTCAPASRRDHRLRFAPLEWERTLAFMADLAGRKGFVVDPTPQVDILDAGFFPPERPDFRTDLANAFRVVEPWTFVLHMPRALIELWTSARDASNAVVNDADDGNLTLACSSATSFLDALVAAPEWVEVADSTAGKKVYEAYDLARRMTLADADLPDDDDALLASIAP